MSAGAVTAIIVIIAVTGILLMRFRKRWLAKINIPFTNRITGPFAGWLPGFGILTHVGRKSGKVSADVEICVIPCAWSVDAAVRIMKKATKFENAIPR
jgi:hypothetical protein